MKKTILAGLCLVVLVSGGFALEKAAGFGLLFGKTFSSGQINDSYSYYDYYSGKTITESYTADWEMDRTSFGAFGFFGMSQFIEFNFGLLYKSIGTVREGSVIVSGDQAGIESTTALQIGIYGKYPIVMSDALVIFPTAGIDYEFTIGGNTDATTGLEWWDDLWIRAGIGADYFINETMFLRGHLIYGAAVPVGGDDRLGIKTGNGLLVKVGLGWMF